MTAALPLSTLLSQTLVAFTIEFDNEAERHVAHRTTDHGSTGSVDAPWLVSLAMWFHCVQFLGKAGMTVVRLEELARTTTNLNGLERWGYIVVRPDPADTRPKPPRADWVIRATPAGLRAQSVWRPLLAVIEQRWETRFGQNAIDALRNSLQQLLDQIDMDLPDYLPILTYGLFSRLSSRRPATSAGTGDDARRCLPLPVLLSRALLWFAVDFERNWELSLAISANLLRVLDDQGIRLRDLPLVTGVSKEAINMAMGVLRKRGIAVVEPDRTGARAKIGRLTPKGQAARDAYRQRIATVEKHWRERFGETTIRALRAPLEQLVGEPTWHSSPLSRGLAAHPEGWRASAPTPETLPHFPMVLHRGGFPDGS